VWRALRRELQVGTGMADDIGDQDERQRMSVRELEHRIVLVVRYPPIA